MCQWNPMTTRNKLQVRVVQLVKMRYRTSGILDRNLWRYWSSTASTCEPWRFLCLPGMYPSWGQFPPCARYPQNLPWVKIIGSCRSCSRNGWNGGTFTWHRSMPTWSVSWWNTTMEKGRKGKKNSPPGSERSEKPSREKSEEEIEDESGKEDEEDDDEESSDVPYASSRNWGSRWKRFQGVLGPADRWGEKHSHQIL